MCSSDLSQMEDLIARAKELMLSQANTATSTTTTREGVALELMSLRSQMLTLANSRINSQYVFAGTDNATPPFAGATATATAGGANTGAAVATVSVSDETLLTGDAYQVRFTAPGVFDLVNATTGAIALADMPHVSGQAIAFGGIEITIDDGATPPAAGDVFDIATALPGAYSGNGGEMRVEIEANNFLALNISGNRLFQGEGLPGGVNLFEVFNHAIHTLRTDDTDELDAALNQFDTAKVQVSEFRSAMGARQNMLSTTESRIRSRILDLNTERSFLEDIDLIEAATEFNRRETSYKATLSVTSRIGQVSLLDFLR